MKKKMIKILTLILVANLLIYTSVMAYSNYNETQQFQNTITYFDMETREMVTEEIPTLEQIMIEKNRSNLSSTISSNLNITIDENGGRIEPYIANPIAEVEPNIIIGGDNRTPVTNTTVYPYKTVCYLEVTFPDGTTSLYGTGVLVYKDVVLTAGHVVYQPKHGGYATKVAVFPGRAGGPGVQGSEPYLYTTVQNLYVDPQYVSNQSAYYDWAMMKTYDPIGNYVGAWMGIAYSGDYSFFVNDGLSVSIVGYPEDKGKYYQYYSRDRVAYAENRFMAYYTDSFRGQSGSPVYEQDQYVVAIHHGDWPNSQPALNLGVNINQSRFSLIVSWMN